MTETDRDPALETLTSRALSAGSRAGIGFDAHRLMSGRRLRLGGLDFPGTRGLAGHSDGDVVLHAVIDALLGSAHLGDIGSLFPSGDERFRDADSAELLRLAVGRLRDAGWTPSSIDVVIAAASPSIALVRDTMEHRIADLLEIPAESASVKATTTDGLGLVAGDGIAAYVICVVQAAR